VSTTVVRNDELSRYDILVDDEVVGHADYRLDGDRQVFVHTEIDRAHRGQDLAAPLVRAALDDARANGMEVVPRCPYVAEFIAEHPEYADLVRPSS
jgi:predicted GNAT family acetyltransferase